MSSRIILLSSSPLRATLFIFLFARTNDIDFQDPKKVAAGKKLAEKNRQAKAALEREVKREREIAEREQENENSAGWLPEMSFQTVLSIVGITFTAFELYQRFRQKKSSGGGINAEHNSVQSPISQITAEPRKEPKQSGAKPLALTEG